MNRRGFLEISSGAALALVAPHSGVKGQQKQTARKVAGSRNYAGLSLVELGDQYRSDLFADFLPFMDKFVIDHELGGFMCNTDHTGARVNDNKLSWFEGRGTWVYSFLYNNLAREQKYLDVARRSVEFTLKSKPPEGELWPKELTREGKQLTSADGEIYGDIFIAEGLAEYSKATGERPYLGHGPGDSVQVHRYLRSTRLSAGYWTNLSGANCKVFSGCACSGCVDGTDPACHTDAGNASRYGH